MAIITIPSNIWAISNYKRNKQMNKELLILIYALCCYNFLTIPVNFINGLARMVDNFPLGEFGCFIALPFGAVVNNSTSLTLAVISYERRTVVTSRTIEPKSRVVKMIGFLIAIYIFSIFTYCFVIYYLLESVRIVKYPIYGPQQPKVDICLPQMNKTVIPIDPLIGLFHFVIPFSITSYNYGYLWIHIRRHKTASHSSLERNSQKHVFFAWLMVICLLEFVIFQLPFDLVLMMARFQNENGQLTLQTSAYFISYVFIYTDNIINPLWFSFASFRRSKGKFSSPRFQSAKSTSPVRSMVKLNENDFDSKILFNS